MALAAARPAQLKPATLGRRHEASVGFWRLPELEPRFAAGDTDLAFTVRASRDGFVGETKTWIERHAWFAFAQGLTVLEEQRSGEVNVQSMSPGELNLTVKAIDRLGPSV